MTLNFSCSRFASINEMLDAECACAYDATEDAGLLEAVLDQASDILALITGLRVHGICTRTVRPVGNESCIPESVWYWQSGSGPWHLQGTVPLRGPRTDIVEVLVDGVLLSIGDYYLIEDRYLARRNASWPTQNDLSKDETQVGTWAITYRFGRAPDYLTKQATIELACELASFATTGKSNLPDGVTSANIQGAQVTLQDRAEALANGANDGLPSIARFLGVYSPDGQSRSGVWSPELNLGVDLIEVEGPSGS